MKDTGNNQGNLLKVISILLAFSIGLNLILLIRRSEKANYNRTLVAENQRTLRQINQYRFEIEKYKGISQKIDEVVGDANKNMEEKERRITRLMLEKETTERDQKETAEMERNMLVHQADSLRELYLNVIDSLLVERETKKVINTKIGQLEDIIYGLNSRLGNSELLSVDGLYVKPLRITSTGKRQPTAFAKRVNSVEIRFDIGINKLATPGLKNVYILITSPDGRVLTDSRYGKTFDFYNPESEKTAQCTIVQSFNYRNDKISISDRFEPEEELNPGLYVIELFTDMNKMATTTLTLR